MTAETERARREAAQAWRARGSAAVVLIARAMRDASQREHAVRELSASAHALHAAGFDLTEVQQLLTAVVYIAIGEGAAGRGSVGIQLFAEALIAECVAGLDVDSFSPAGRKREDSPR